uniref:Spindle and centriole-associated protein 1 n=1 Tax=Amphilophus citrinellus TaxID=61819 RepID=A0A3Q0T1X2_AMPCI
MSFMRVGRPQQHTKGKRPARPKKAAAQRKEWVVSLSFDCVVVLLQSHRHEIHKSHNKAAAQWELKERALKRRLRHSGSPAPLDQASLSIIREVFSDQLLLQDVLSRSDRALAVVKDLFGDAPRRHTGHPSVTVAPNCDSDSELPVLQRPDPPTHLSLLSQSMMDQEALNELEASEEDQRDDVHPSGSSEYHIIRSDQEIICNISGFRDQHEHLSRLVSALNATVAVQRVRSKQSQSEEDKEETSVLVSQVLNPELNQSKSGLRSRTNRARKCVSQGSDLDGSSVASLSRDQSSLGLLQAMLGQVESDLDALSPDTAPPSAQSPKWHRTQGLTGFSVALVSTLGRLVHLLKQREDEAQNEAQERRKLEEELKEQRGLIDALTAESMTLREEAAALQRLFLLLSCSHLLDSRTIGSTFLVTVIFKLLSDYKSLPQKLFAFRGLIFYPSSSAVTHPVLPHQQLPSVDSLSSYGDLQAHSSDSNSLPLTKLPSTSSLSLTSDPLRSPLSPGTLLAEIAQLSRETDLIRAQLSQPKGLGSGVREPLDSGNERRRSSCSSAGKVTPQSVGERRIVEQRLLELNRQSAAARGRLLEIIEQQKQSISVRVSPSVSPIPASAFSPDAMDKERKREGWFALSAHVR